MAAEDSLKAIGISSVVIGGLVLIGIISLAYKNFYDLQLTKLNILKAQRDLEMPLNNELIKAQIKKII